MSVRILVGDALARLKDLPDNSARMCWTSPPYWGLRDYGVAGQLGLEATPEAYADALVAVMREVRRVLTPDGTLWLNMGDSYVAKPNSNKHTDTSTLTKPKGRPRKRDLPSTGRIGRSGNKGNAASDLTRAPHRGQVAGLKPKDLIGIPWRVAFALQADGWYLRRDIIWQKPNPMPESVSDRPTTAHEYVFLLSRSERYYYDAKAVAEPAVYGSSGRASKKRGEFAGKTNALPGREAFRAITETRNRRSVWTIPTEPSKEAHFAMAPSALVDICVRAGSAIGDTVLDPFAGAGTTALAASRLGRSGLLVELNAENVPIIQRRLARDNSLFVDVELVA